MTETNRYQLQEILGQGGMGVVHRALDTVLGREVALKLLSPHFNHNEALIRRLQQEMLVVSRLEHPHIVPIYDADLLDGQLFLAMRLLRGGTMRDRLTNGEMTLAQLLPVARQIALALDTAHAQKIVHRDIKPGNILFDEQGTAYLSDFGIAKVQDATTQLTGTNLLGTPAYMSPEQFKGQTLDGCSDQYSLAVVLFEALTGQPPFTGETLQVMYQHVHTPPPEIHQLNPALNSALSTTLARGLAKDPAERFPDVTTFVTALTAANSSHTMLLAATKPEPATPQGHIRLSDRFSNSSLTSLPVNIVSEAGGTKTNSSFRLRRWVGPIILIFLVITIGLGFWSGLFTPYPTPARGLLDENTAEPISVLITGAVENATWRVGDGIEPIVADKEIHLPRGGTPLQVHAATGILEITLPDDARLIVQADSIVELAAGDDLETGNEFHIVLLEGRMVVEATTYPLIVQNPYGASGQTNGIMGLAYQEAPFIFEIDCLQGDCQIVGDLADEALALKSGERSRVGGSGKPSSPEPARYEWYTAMVAGLPTATATSTATMTPLPALTPTTMATETATPTETAVVTTVTATASATSTSTSAPQALTSGGGLPLNFVSFGVWVRGDEPHGTFTHTPEQSRTGGFAAKLAYDFPTNGNDYVVFTQFNTISGTPNALQVWVYGDGAGHYLNAWIQDAGGQTWQVPFGRITHTGWRQMTGHIQTGQDWPWTHISGPNNQQINYPIRFRAFVLDDFPDTFIGQGVIYLDDLTAVTLSGTPVPTSNSGGATLTPVSGTITATPSSESPSGTVGQIIYTSGNTILTTDPSWSSPLELGTAAQNTCGNIASLVTGPTFSLYKGLYCGIGEGPSTCQSPNSQHQVMVHGSFSDGFSIRVGVTGGGGDPVFIYNGPLDTTEGIRWSPLSNSFLFVVNDTVNQAFPGGGYHQIIPTAYTPIFSPDGSLILYRKPVGPGVNDIFVANADGTQPRNLTNVTTIDKRCAAWIIP